MISDFHLLRPWLLILLVFPVGIFWLVDRATDIRSRWRGVIAPHLLDNLIVASSATSRVRPSLLFSAILVLGIVGASGPTWDRVPPPFVADTATLVVAVDLSQTMDAIDVTPSRIERAKLKIKDVIDRRPGARTAIVAYAGSAHLVMPPTEDAGLLESYSEALATRIMPKPGKNTVAALNMASDVLEKEGSTGTILLLTDGLEPAATQAIRSSPNGVVVLGVGTSAGGPVRSPDGGFATDASGSRLLSSLDTAHLESLDKETGADVATVTDDDADVRWVLDRIRSNFAERQTTSGENWRDQGWWLVLPAALAMAYSFRRGWVVRTSVILLALHLSSPRDAHASGFVDLWLTKDQQGQLAFERGDYEDAARLFADPMWKGVASYKAAKFQDAVDAFSAVDTPESWYDQGNAFAHLGRLDDAVAAFETALRARPEWAEATANLELVRRLLKAQKDKQEEQPDQPSETPDSVQFDEKGKQGKEGVINIAEQTSQMWIDNIVVSPADLMARKFSIEAGTISE